MKLIQNSSAKTPTMQNKRLTAAVDGSFVGEGVGLLVGEGVGFGVGLAEGTGVGFGDGLFVGLEVVGYNWRIR